MLPSENDLGFFRKFEQQAGIPPPERRGAAQGDGFKIVWDATNYQDVAETIEGVERVLSAMAYISPQTDYRPTIAKADNTDASVNIIHAIEAQPDGTERIKFVYTGTVAGFSHRTIRSLGGAPICQILTRNQNGRDSIMDMMSRKPHWS